MQTSSLDRIRRVRDLAFGIAMLLWCLTLLVRAIVGEGATADAVNIVLGIAATLGALLAFALAVHVWRRGGRESSDNSVLGWISFAAGLDVVAIVYVSVTELT